MITRERNCVVVFVAQGSAGGLVALNPDAFTLGDLARPARAPEIPPHVVHLDTLGGDAEAGVEAFQLLLKPCQEL